MSTDHTHQLGDVKQLLDQQLDDYKAMNDVFRGRFGTEPGVRTTIAAAGGIPGDSHVEIDCIAYV